MRPIRVHALVLALAVLPACISPTEFRLQGPLSIEAEGGSLQLGNHTRETVYTFVVERSSAALINWAPCTDPAQCDGIAPNQRRRIPYSRITGYEPGEHEAIVYWWHLEARRGGGFRPDRIRAEVVRL
ncbi:MAG TPA: hypothetical protein VGR37_15465 [Longimicrobiaceae bacterium]|nr:hypothetical protein [Longimicrobiaceae bacterium]